MSTMDNKPAVAHDPDKPFNVTLNLDISPTAAAMVRHDFNPSQSGEVARLKLLAAALITACEAIRERGPQVWDKPPDPSAVAEARHFRKRKDGSRCAAVAITNIEQGAMWAVKAATAV